MLLGIFAGARGLSIVEADSRVRHAPETITDELAATYDLVGTDAVLVDGAAVIVAFYELRPSSSPWTRAIHRESESG